MGLAGFLYDQARTTSLRIKLVAYFYEIHFLWFMIKSFEKEQNSLFFCHSGSFGQLFLYMQIDNYSFLLFSLLISVHSDTS